MAPQAEESRSDDIKTMKLYSHVERIENELRARGLWYDSDSGAVGGGGGDGAAAESGGRRAPLDPSALSPIDSMHYGGDSSVLAAVEALGVTASSSLLDVGSGFGGPARVLARATGCRVSALELQGDVHSTAVRLTDMCGLSGRVQHVRGDVLGCDLRALGDGPGTFDGVASWLVFLHIPEKAALFGRCAEALRGGGSIFVDDFYARGGFTEDEEASLKDDVYCSDLPTREEYVGAVESAGFGDVVWEDKTADWTEYVNNRLEQFTAGRERFERTHGQPTYEKLLHFYNAMVKLFNGGHLGGVRLCARKM